MRDIVIPSTRDRAETLAGGLAGLVVVLQAHLILAHVAWRDESQAYLLATQPDIGDLFAALHYEGHPALWHLLVRAAATITPSLAALKLLQLPIALGAAWLLWFRAPFSPWFRLALLTSYFVLFEYGVIARSYGLGALLLFAFLAARERFARWLFLALMANISAHFMLLSGALVAASILSAERRPRIDARLALGLGLWALGCLVAIAAARPAPDARPVTTLHAEFVLNFATALHWASASLWPGVATWGVGAFVPVSVLLGAGVGLLGVTALARRPRSAAIWLGFYLTLLAFSTLVYPAFGRHVGTWVLLLVALLWIDAEDHGARPSFAARLWIGALSLFGLACAASAAVKPFVAADMAARWLADNHLEARVICAYPGWDGVDLSARTGKPYFNLQTGRLARFETWNYDAHAPQDAASVAGFARAAAKTLGPELIIYGEADDPDLTLLGAERLIVFPATFAGKPKAFFRFTP